jgi:hypothetical protein
MRFRSELPASTLQAISIDVRPCRRPALCCYSGAADVTQIHVCCDHAMHGHAPQNASQWPAPHRECGVVVTINMHAGHGQHARRPVNMHTHLGSIQCVTQLPAAAWLLSPFLTRGRGEDTMLGNCDLDRYHICMCRLWLPACCLLRQAAAAAQKKPRK